MNVVTLTTDFGADSPYVAAMKGVLLSLAPRTTIVDLTHSIPPQHVRYGAIVLDQVCERYPPGTLHVAVVDPGVGTEREIVYIEIGAQRYLGPDNGLFSRIASRIKPTRVIAVDRPEFWLPSVSATFHGRDIMAPVAARLSEGLEPARIGTPRDGIFVLDWPQPIAGANSICGEILLVDSFGNLITNIERALLASIPSGTIPRISTSAISITGISRAYGERVAGETVALVGSSELLEIAVVNGNAAQTLGMRAGDPIQIEWQAE